MSVYSRMAAANAAANAVSPGGSDGGASGPELASAAAVAAAAAGRSTQGWATYVQKLLEQGEVLRAVRVAREHRGVLASGATLDAV